MDLRHAPKIGYLTDHVNGNMTDSWKGRTRLKYRTMLKEILQRIESRLEALDLTEAGAAKAAGLSDSAIRNIRRAVADGQEERGVSTSTLLRLAPILQTSASWLIEGVDCGGDLPASARRMWETFKIVSNMPKEIQDRVTEFAEFQIGLYAKSRETATKPDG
jgi:transcriptional regulator with XRE-family HTH domain